MYDYRKFFEEKLKEVAKENYILDVGGGHPFQKKLASYQDFFKGKRYETLDFSPEYKPTIVADVHNIPLVEGSVDAILCLSVLEHLYNPQKAIDEIYRVLKKGGQFLGYTHFIYPYHARQGIYGDYFRFTDEGLNHLFNKFSKVELKKDGGYFKAVCFFLPYQAKLKWLWEPIAYFFDKLFKTEKRTTTAAFYIYAIK